MAKEEEREQEKEKEEEQEEEESRRQRLYDGEEATFSNSMGYMRTPFKVSGDKRPVFKLSTAFSSGNKKYFNK